jgi:hypothetical protein
MRKRIAILFHANDRSRRPSRYMLAQIAKYWIDDGHEVVHLFGTREFVPADVAILHVNLSRVPEEYIELAQRYPVALNGRVSDIRKSSISRNLLQPHDEYDGEVIVKSDLNFAGRPERKLSSSWISGNSHLARRLWRLKGRLLPRSARFERPAEYRIYARLRDVPRACFENEQLVVEKFLPERTGDLYSVRNLIFLGNRTVCVRLSSSDPIVGIGNIAEIEPVEPHPEILGLREKLRFDYGKFDYVVCDGKATLLDANKTIGVAPSTDAAREARRRRLADGLYSYFG